MAVKIQLFGQLKQITGASEIFMDASDTDELVRAMADRYPGIGNLTYLIAVDRNVVLANTAIKTGQELALLPPYSGG